MQNIHLNMLTQYNPGTDTISAIEGMLKVYFKYANIHTTKKEK